MQVADLIREINELSDEQEASEIVLAFINDALAKINIECSAVFPFLDLEVNTEPVFPESWQRALLIPFGVGRVKQRDSSQFEYTDAYAEFMNNLTDFKAKYEIPEEYRSGDGSSEYAMPGYLTNPPIGWGGW